MWSKSAPSWLYAMLALGALNTALGPRHIHVIAANSLPSFAVADGDDVDSGPANVNPSDSDDDDDDDDDDDEDA
ncbi:MAG: hypothetical protein KGR26_12525 [Cyanobacteria bacterium REEB65]|nr:hypothetical protein [Cyanobacteria bacterium REEB65]